MKVEIEQTIKVTLVLTETEARWLRDQMQNSFNPDEDHFDAEMRKKFWETLDGCKEL